MTPVDLVLDALAVSRITRLITHDRIGAHLRKPIIKAAYGWSNNVQGWTDAEVAYSAQEWDQVVHDDDEPPELAAFIVCPWCVGQWVAFGVVLARWAFPRKWEPLGRALAFSQIAGFVADLDV